MYFLKPHPQQTEILQWAAEWSRHCAILFYHTTKLGDSDIRVDFNEGIIHTTYIIIMCVILRYTSLTINKIGSDSRAVLSVLVHY